MNRLAATLALATVTLAGARSTALAHGPDAIFDPLTMDPHTPVTKLDVDFSYIAYDEPDNVDITVIGFAIGGQYVTPLGFGGYLTLPLSYLSSSATIGPFGFDDSELALGNLELGGLYAKYISDHAAVVVHGGIALPTASDEGIAALQFAASSPRYGDLVQRVPSSSWFRLGVSPMGRAGKLFWRADVGLDLALDEEDSALSPVFRIAFGGGLDLRSVHLLVEYVTDITDDDAGDEVASTLALGARFLSGKVRPGIALLLPIDFEGMNEPEFAIAASLAVRL